MTATIACCTLLGLELVVDILPPNGNNISAGTLTNGTFETISEHDTANPNLGANARMHWQFVKNGGGPAQASFTYAVDDKQAIQILREDQINYAQGTVKGNRTSISIERCVNRDANQAKAIDNNAKLTAAILVAHNKKLEAVIQHHAWYGKNCPASLRNVPGAWEAFVGQIGGHTATLNNLLNPPGAHPIVVPAFKAFYQAEPKSLQYFGLPITDAEQAVLSDGKLHTIQYFERARFELHGDKVLLGLLGVEVLNG